MGDVEAPQDQILNLWPTLFGQTNLPDHERHDAEFTALAARGADVGTDDLFASDSAAARWLEGHVQGAVAAWVEGAECIDVTLARPRGWVESIGFCDYRDLGNDAGAFLAGLYFVNEPAPAELDHVRSDCLPSCVSFFDPRIGFNATAVEGDPYYSQAFTVLPEAGKLLIWPGYVRHLTRVHLARASWHMVRFQVPALKQS